MERGQLGSRAIQRWELCEATVTLCLQALPGVPASLQQAMRMVSQSSDSLLCKKFAVGVTESGRLSKLPWSGVFCKQELQ